MKSEAIELISLLDASLAIVREFWLSASPNSRGRTKHLGQINELLDQRISLMRLRDAGSLNSQPSTLNSAAA